MGCTEAPCFLVQFRGIGSLLVLDSNKGPLTLTPYLFIITGMDVRPRQVRPPRTRANRPEVIMRRARIIGYYEAGKGLREISHLLGISRGTVRLWVRRYEEEGHVLTRPRSGGPRITTPAEDQQII